MSETFNKKALSETLADQFDLKKKDAVEVVDAVLGAIRDELVKGNKVDFSGFGKFEVKDRPARDGFNPQTKEKIRIPASKALTFKVSKTLKDSINK